MFYKRWTRHHIVDYPKRYIFQEQKSKQLNLRYYTVTRLSTLDQQSQSTHATSHRPQSTGRALSTIMGEDLSQLSQAELISRCTRLEQQLQAQTAQIAELSKATQGADNSLSARINKKPAKQFDASRHATRFVALKLSYLGHQYNGFEHANRCFTPLPTVEEVLWKALRKARLISPPVPEDADASFEVTYDPKARERKYFSYRGTKPEHDQGKVRLEISWEGCQYSKCGRTDRGVSAFGQVIGIRLRSNAPISTKRSGSDDEKLESAEMAGNGMDAAEPEEEYSDFHPISEELPYVYMLNMLLPPDIRILAWCPFPPEGFDARFSCLERRYKYFFTNPAFCPTPGPMGLTQTPGTSEPIREGWLDISRMREAANKLVGLHDYRNFCQLDASKQMSSCERRINFADIQEIDSTPTAFATDPNLNALGEELSVNGHVESASGPKVFAIVIHGTAFLWHQVRCIAAVLFLVGQGLESPDVVERLLNINETPGRPHYTMADDAPLVLWDCVFPGDEGAGQGGLHWIYNGDEVTVPALTSKGDGKYGLGGVVDELWAQWRDVKIREAQINGLLSLAMSKGDTSSIERGGFRDPSSIKNRSQKVFEGAGKARLVGEYTPLMQRRQMDRLEVVNARYLATTKGARRFPKTLVLDNQE